MNYERSAVDVARSNRMCMSALKRGPLWPTITSVAMTTSVTMPPGPLPIVLSALPGWNRHTFPDNVAYYGHSGIIFFFFTQKENILLLQHYHKRSTKLGWQVGAVGDSPVPVSSGKAGLALCSARSSHCCKFPFSASETAKIGLDYEREKFSLALQLLDHDLVLIKNHLGTAGNHPLINVAAISQSPDSQIFKVKPEPKTASLGLIREQARERI